MIKIPEDTVVSHGSVSKRKLLHSKHWQVMYGCCTPQAGTFTRCKHFVSKHKAEEFEAMLLLIMEEPDYGL